MSKILALDTSHAHCSVALNCNGSIDFLQIVEPRQHAHRLLPMIQELLRRNAVSIRELDAIAVVNGPGSFTGLRIGVGVAQGLAFGAQLPVLGVSSMAVMAFKSLRDLDANEALVCLQAREHELYSAAYRLIGEDVQLLGEERVGGIDSIRLGSLEFPNDAYFVGDARLLAVEAISRRGEQTLQIYNKECTADAQTLSIIAATRFALGAAVEPALAQPIYLKEQMDYQD